MSLGPAIPILFVRDVAASAAFYRDTLGFAIDFLYGEPPFYGAVSRGEACLHLRCVHEPNFAALAARELMKACNRGRWRRIRRSAANWSPPCQRWARSVSSVVSSGQLTAFGNGGGTTVIAISGVWKSRGDGTSSPLAGFAASF